MNCFLADAPIRFVPSSSLDRMAERCVGRATASARWPGAMSWQASRLLSYQQIEVICVTIAMNFDSQKLDPTALLAMCRLLKIAVHLAGNSSSRINLVLRLMTILSSCVPTSTWRKKWMRHVLSWNNTSDNRRVNLVHRMSHRKAVHAMRATIDDLLKVILNPNLKLLVFYAKSLKWLPPVDASLRIELNWIELYWILSSKYTCVDTKVRHVTCTKIIEHLGSEALTGILVQKYI